MRIGGIVLYKSKKQNYPGLYGKFQKIDTSNLHKLQQKQQTETKDKLKHDFSTDEDLESLETLIKNLKKSAKEQVNAFVADTQGRSEVEMPTISDHEIDDRLLKLKQEKSLLDDFDHKKSATEPFELDVLSQIDTGEDTPEEELFSSLVTDSSFIDDLEHDILEECSVEDDDISLLEQTIRSLTERINQLSDNKRLILLQGSVFQEFLKVLDL